MRELNLAVTSRRLVSSRSRYRSRYVSLNRNNCNPGGLILCGGARRSGDTMPLRLGPRQHTVLVTLSSDGDDGFVAAGAAEGESYLRVAGDNRPDGYISCGMLRLEEEVMTEICFGSVEWGCFSRRRMEFTAAF